MNSKHKLDIQMSWWGMTSLGGDRTSWTAEEKVRQIADAGFDGINGFVPASENADRWRQLLQTYNLSFSVNAYPRNADDMEQFLIAAKRYGGIDYINAQVMTPFLTGEGAEALLHHINLLSGQYGIPVYVETHRGTITQDLLRTTAYVKHLDELRLTIDFSHYVVAGELHTVSEEAEALLQQLLVRTSSIHTRVSNGEQVQIDIGDNGEHIMVPHYKRWWKDGMRHWTEQAASGSRFPVVVELGPPGYAITIDEHAARSMEISDRWTQSLLFQRIIRSIWDELSNE